MSTRSSDWTNNTNGSKIIGIVYRLKQLINQGKPPIFLVQTNIFGSFVFIALAVLLVIFYFQLKSDHNQYVQYAYAGYFSAYFTSVIKSIAAVTEIAVSINDNLMQNATQRTAFTKQVTTVYSSRVPRVISAYNQYLVNYDIRSIVPNIESTRYSMLMNRSTFDTTPSLYDFQESTTFLCGLIYSLNKTAIAKITDSNYNVQFFRDYGWDYVITYETIRGDVFTNFYAQKDVVWSTGLAMILTIVIFCVIVTCVFSVFVFIIHKQEVSIISKLCTVPDEYTTIYLQKLQVAYKNFFFKDLRLKQFEKSLSKQEEAKGTRKLATKKFANRSTKSIYYLLFFLVVMITMAIFAGVSAQSMYNNVERTTTFIEDIDILCSMVPWMSFSSSWRYRMMQLLEIVPEYIERYANWTIAEGRMVDMMQNLQSRIFENPDATPALKARYLNLTNNNFCYDEIGTVNYAICLSSFNAAASLGFASFYDASYKDLFSQMAQFERNLTFANAVAILYKDDTYQFIYNSNSVDTILFNTLQIEVPFLYGYYQDLENGLLTKFLILGLAVVLCLYVFIWRQIYRNMKIQFMEARQVFSQLPVELIMHNNYIKNMLKQDGVSSI